MICSLLSDGFHEIWARLFHITRSFWLRSTAAAPNEVRWGGFSDLGHGLGLDMTRKSFFGTYCSCPQKESCMRSVTSTFLSSLQHLLYLTNCEWKKFMSKKKKKKQVWALADFLGCLHRSTMSLLKECLWEVPMLITAIFHFRANIFNFLTWEMNDLSLKASTWTWGEKNHFVSPISSLCKTSGWSLQNQTIELNNYSNGHCFVVFKSQRIQLKKKTCLISVSR